MSFVLKKVFDTIFDRGEKKHKIRKVGVKVLSFVLRFMVRATEWMKQSLVKAKPILMEVNGSLKQ